MSGLSAGETLEKLIRDDLPENVELDREEALLAAAAAQAGLLDTYLTAERRRADEAARAAGGELIECATGALTGAPLAHRG